MESFLVIFFQAWIHGFPSHSYMLWLALVTDLFIGWVGVDVLSPSKRKILEYHVVGGKPGSIFNLFGHV